MKTSGVHWREIAELIQGFFLPGRFDKEIQALFDQGYAQDEAVRILCGLVGHYLVEGAGLAAALGAPLRSAVENLSELSAFLGALANSVYARNGSGTYRAFFRYEEAYARFVAQMQPVLADLGPVVASVLSIYISDALDLEGAPNQLVLRSLRVVDQDLGRAKYMIARAAAMAMMGKRLWWGWPQEVAPELRPWARHVMGFVSSITHDGERPFRNAVLERRRWAQEEIYLQPLLSVLKDGSLSLARIQFSQRTEPVDAVVEKLIFALFAGRGAISEEVLTAFAIHREAAIPHLIGVALDRRLGGKASIGDGWAPIHAVDTLGALRAGDASEALVKLLVLTEPDELLHERALLAIQKIGPLALPCLLDAMAYSSDDQLKLSLASTLGVVGRGSPDACDALIALYRGLGGAQDPGLVILGLVELQDRRTIPTLSDALLDSRLLPMDLDEIEEALASMEVMV